MGFWNGVSTLKHYFVLPNNGSKYYLKYTFLAFPVLGILGLGTPLVRGTTPTHRRLFKTPVGAAHTTETVSESYSCTMVYSTP